MRIRLVAFCIAALLMTGCTAKTDDNMKGNPLDNEPIEQVDVIDEEIGKILTADPAKFHFVADWLTDKKIVYVEKDEGFYKVNTFDLNTGETDTLHEEKSIVIDVLIHPSKNIYYYIQVIIQLLQRLKSYRRTVLYRMKLKLLQQNWPLSGMI